MLVIIFVLLFVTHSSCEEKVFFASKDGNDTGICDSEENACLTLNYIMNLAEFKNLNSSYEVDIRITSATYEINEEVVFDTIFNSLSIVSFKVFKCTLSISSTGSLTMTAGNNNIIGFVIVNTFNERTESSSSTQQRVISTGTFHRCAFKFSNSNEDNNLLLKGDIFRSGSFFGNDSSHYNVTLDIKLYDGILFQNGNENDLFPIFDSSSLSHISIKYSSFDEPFSFNLNNSQTFDFQYCEIRGLNQFVVSSGGTLNFHSCKFSGLKSSIFGAGFSPFIISENGVVSIDGNSISNYFRSFLHIDSLFLLTDSSATLRINGGKIYSNTFNHGIFASSSSSSSSSTTTTTTTKSSIIELSNVEFEDNVGMYLMNINNDNVICSNVNIENADLYNSLIYCDPDPDDDESMQMIFGNNSKITPRITGMNCVNDKKQCSINQETCVDFMKEINNDHEPITPRKGLLLFRRIAIIVGIIIIFVVCCVCLLIAVIIIAVVIHILIKISKKKNSYKKIENYYYD